METTQRNVWQRTHDLIFKKGICKDHNTFFEPPVLLITQSAMLLFYSTMKTY